MNVVEVCTAGVGGVGDMHPAAGEAPDQETVHGAEAQFARRGAVTRAIHTIQNPRKLGAGEIGVEEQASLCRHHLFMAGILHHSADIGCAPVLPDNGVMNCLAGGAVPYDRRFALVRDPYGDGKAAAGPRFFDHGAGDVDGGLPDGFGIMFNPSIVREDLREFCRLLGQNGAGLIEQDGARAGGSLVDGNDGAKLGHDISGSCPCLALRRGAAAAFRFQILFPFLMRLRDRKDERPARYSRSGFHV